MVLDGLTALVCDEWVTIRVHPSPGACLLGFFVFGETTVNAARIFPQRSRIRRRSARPGLRRRVALVMSVSLVMLGGALVVPVLAPAAGAVTPNAAPAAGARKSATRLGFTVSGTAGLSVDVATGNAEFTDQLVTLPGVNSDVSVALAWNSSVVGTSLPRRSPVVPGRDG